MDDIKKIIKEGKTVIGTNEVLKKLKAGKLSKVFVTSNCPSDVKEDIEKYAAIAEADVVQLKIPNDELGVLHKKQFAISVLGLLK